MRDVQADKCKIPQAFWRVFDHLGLQPAAVLRKASLPTTLYLSKQQLFTTAQLFAIWKSVEEMTADPTFGIRMVKVSDITGNKTYAVAGNRQFVDVYFDYVSHLY